MGRTPCCEKKGLKKGRWTIEEDEILVNYIAQNGEGSWKLLPKNAGLLRCGKSCRLRWINYLRGGLKRGNISKEEEEVIIKLHSTIGNRWSLIAAQLPGRTDNEIKNYWNSHLSRSIHSFRRCPGNPTAVYDPPAGKRRGGRTSRAAMKKNSTLTVKSNGGQKVDKNGDVDFVVDLERFAGKEGGMEGEEMVKVMEEMEKALMADLESLEAELWEGDECEIWPWLWEMSGSDELPPAMCGDIFF